MNRYRLDATDLHFAREFLAQPIGYHSPGLQRVLNLMRGGIGGTKYILIVLERHKRWQLGRLPLRRGAAVVPIEGVFYQDLLTAERDIFQRRWQDLVQGDPALALDNSHLSCI